MNSPQSAHSQYLKSLFDTHPTADDLFEKANQLKNSNPNQKELHDFLELGHLTIVNKTISEANKIEEWFEIIHELILESKLTVGHLINQRARYYGDKICFQEIEGNQIRKFTYQQIWDQIIQIGNTTGSAITTTVTLTSDTSGRTNANDEANETVEILTGTAIPANDTLAVLSGSKLVMEATDSMTVVGTGAVDVTMSVMEIT